MIRRSGPTKRSMRRSSVAHSLVAQANSHALLGEWEPALALHRRALALRTRLLGAEHTRIAGVLNNIGELLIERSDYFAAKDRLQRALEIREVLGKGSAVEISNVLVNLGALERALGRPAAARGHLERALTLREEVLGPRHRGRAARPGLGSRDDRRALPGR